MAQPVSHSTSASSAASEPHHKVTEKTRVHKVFEQSLSSADGAAEKLWYSRAASRTKEMEANKASGTPVDEGSEKSDAAAEEAQSPSYTATIPNIPEVDEAWWKGLQQDIEEAKKADHLGKLVDCWEEISDFADVTRKEHQHADQRYRAAQTSNQSPEDIERLKTACEAKEKRYFEVSKQLFALENYLSTKARELEGLLTKECSHMLERTQREPRIVLAHQSKYNERIRELVGSMYQFLAIFPERLQKQAVVYAWKTQLDQAAANMTEVALTNAITQKSAPLIEEELKKASFLLGFIEKEREGLSNEKADWMKMKAELGAVFSFGSTKGVHPRKKDTALEIGDKLREISAALQLVEEAEKKIKDVLTTRCETAQAMLPLLSKPAASKGDADKLQNVTDAVNATATAALHPQK